MKTFVDFTRDNTQYFNYTIKSIDFNYNTTYYLLYAYCDIGYREKMCLAMSDNKEELLIWADLHGIPADKIFN